MKKLLASTCLAIGLFALPAVASAAECGDVTIASMNWQSAEVLANVDKFILNIEEYGNTSSASIPIALDEAVRAGTVREGDLVLMCALGAGFAWGSALIRF